MDRCRKVLLSVTSVIARGSLLELETLLELAKRVGYFDDATLEKAKLLADEVGRMLWVLMEKLGTAGLTIGPRKQSS